MSKTPDYMPLETEKDANYESEPEPELPELKTLASELERLIQTTNLLSHRVDSLQMLMDQDRFELSTMQIRVKPSDRSTHVHTLLEAIGTIEEDLCVGEFLHALNTYLIHNGLVDLNDFQIHLTPLLCAAFNKAPGLKKLPYPLLLLSLPQMFV